MKKKEVQREDDLPQPRDVQNMGERLRFWDFELFGTRSYAF